MENVKVNNTSVLDDIKLACDIINDDIKVNDYEFNNHSPIYKTTNENISNKEYIEALRDRKRVLSIISSGDQIINSILFGAKDIVGIDISRFPKYFLALKLAALKSLNLKAYIEYFYGDLYCPFSIKYYLAIRHNLDDETRFFWDEIYNKFSYQYVYNSNLFNKFSINSKKAIANNPFLTDFNYVITQNRLNDVNIELLMYDIYNVKKLEKGSFDLVNLSNLINYGKSSNRRFSDFILVYKKLLMDLPLNDDGIAITYNMAFHPRLVNYFNDKFCEISRIKDNSKFINTDNEIFVYKKSL